MFTDQSQHASLSGIVLPEKPPSPAAQGNPTIRQSTTVEAARAILAGQPIPEGNYWGPWPTKGKPAERLTELLLAPPLVVTAEELAPLFPDKKALFPDDPEDIRLTALYNAMGPVERAIDEVVADLADGRVCDVLNPLYRHEMRQAQRRTLERLLELAAVEVTHADC